MKETIETNKEEKIKNNNDINKKSRKIDLIKYSRNLIFKYKFIFI